MLDQAFPDEGALIAHLEQLLPGARVHRVVVQRLDLVNDTTVVEARYQLPQRPAALVGPESTLTSTVSR